MVFGLVWGFELVWGWLSLDVGPSAQGWFVQMAGVGEPPILGFNF